MERHQIVDNYVFDELTVVRLGLTLVTCWVTVVNLVFASLGKLICLRSRICPMRSCLWAHARWTDFLMCCQHRLSSFVSRLWRRFDLLYSLQWPFCSFFESHFVLTTHVSLWLGLQQFILLWQWVQSLNWQWEQSLNYSTEPRIPRFLTLLLRGIRLSHNNSPAGSLTPVVAPPRQTTDAVDTNLSHLQHLFAWLASSCGDA